MGVENSRPYELTGLPNLSVPREYDHDDRVSLSLPLRFRLELQRIIGHALLIPFCGLLVFLMKFFRGYRIENIDEVRRQFRVVVGELKNDPVIICANHLTFIDSALMLWAMAPNWWYLFHYRYFSWNLPAGDFFKKRMIFRVVAYLTKCIFIHRDGSKEHKNDILARCRFLVERGNALTIFPEGTRSRTGRFETAKITYGVGKLVSSIPHSRVLCVYLRGHRQTTFSNYPPKNSRFSVRFKLIDPRSQKSGKDAYYETAQRIAHTIHSLEEQYFATR